jgi:hypothetical protein
MDALFSYVPRTRSRIHGPRRILQELRRLRTKTARALTYLHVTEDAQRWTGRTYDVLDRLIQEGELVLPGLEGPDRTVRKRQDVTSGR